MKKILSLLVITLLSTSLLGCEKPLDEDAQATLDKAWAKLADKNAEYDMGTIEFDGKAKVNFDGSEGEVEGAGELRFDSSDVNNAKTAVKADLSASGTLEGESGSVELSGEVKAVDNSTYVFLEDLKLDMGDPNKAVMAELFSNAIKSQWIIMPGNPLNEELMLETNTYKGKEVAEIAKRNNFFEVEKELGPNKYQIVINTEKFKTYLREIAELSDEELTEEELLEVEQTLNSLDYTLKTKIGPEYDIEWIEGSMTAEDPSDGETMNFSFEGTLKDDVSEGSFELTIDGLTPGSLSAEFTAKHDDGQVSIEGPNPDEVLDISSLLGGGLFGGGAPGLPGEGLPVGELPNPAELGL